MLKPDGNRYSVHGVKFSGYDAVAKAMKIDVPLGPHPEVYGIQDKRAQMKDGAPNPFVKPGELTTYATGLSDDFDKQLAKQTAARQPAK